MNGMIFTLDHTLEVGTVAPETRRRLEAAFERLPDWACPSEYEATFVWIGPKNRIEVRLYRVSDAFTVEE